MVVRKSSAARAALDLRHNTTTTMCARCCALNCL